MSGNNTAATTLPDLNVTAPAPSNQTSAPYAVRKIDVQFAIATGFGSFGTGQQTVTITGLRVEAYIEDAQIPDQSNAHIRIYGMTLNQMNELSKAGLFWDTRKNEVIVSAGDSLTGMTTIFRGIIQEAYPDFKGMPETNFYVFASPGPLIQLKPTPPLSYQGPSVDVSTVLGTMATNAGLTLENNGVSVQLSASYFHGTTWDQIVRVVKAANIYATIDTTAGVLAIWPKTGQRSNPPVVISAANGMIGYPQFAQNRVTVRTLFSQRVAAAVTGPGRAIQVVSDLTAANGSFVTSSLTFDLASQRPGGPWDIVIVAYPKTKGSSGG